MQVGRPFYGGFFPPLGTGWHVLSMRVASKEYGYSPLLNSDKEWDSIGLTVK